MHPEYLTPADLARALGVAPTSILARIRRGEVPAHRMPGARTHWRISADAAREFARSAGVVLPPAIIARQVPRA